VRLFKYTQPARAPSEGVDTVQGMTHTPPSEPQHLDWDTISSRVADAYVSRLTTDEIREIKYAFYIIAQNQVRVVTDQPTPTVQPEQEQDNDNHTDQD
jgi:hypothetical protein